MKRFLFFLSALFMAFSLTAQTPAITSFSPSAAPVAGVVTLTGYYFTGAANVAFNGTPCVTFTVLSDTQIKATVPNGATTGPIEVDAGTTAPINFTVLTPAPKITSVSPVAGWVGTLVNITCTGAGTATDVSFNGVSATFVIVSATQVRATVPAGATTGPISVTNPIGTATTGAWKFTVR